MIIGVMEVDFVIHDSFSLKDKRRVIRSLIEKTKGHFNVSIAEVDNNKMHNYSTIGLALVSNSADFVSKSFDKIVNFWENMFDIEIVNVRRELL